MEKVVLGIVDTPAQAERAVEELHHAGFATSEVSVVFPDRHGSHDVGFERHTKAPEGALAGATIGAVVGAALGIALGLGVLALPKLGMFVAAGPVLAALSVAAATGVVLAVVGALFGRSVPEIHAKHYAGKVRRGSVLVAVHASDRGEVRRAREVLRALAATDITATGEAAIPIRAARRGA
jgi:hypothetical protein